MRSISSRILIYFLTLFLPLACTDPDTNVLVSTNDILVVDGTITNLAEPQIIHLNRSKADPLTGRFGTTPVTKATVMVVVDSSLQVPCHETVDGSYQLPSDFKGQIGHAYQLRFTLDDDTQYVSSQQVMQDVPPITKVSARFNPKSLPTTQLYGYTAAHDLFLDSQDPAQQHNYYRWDWKLYERQYWCKTCRNGVYAVHKILPGVYKSDKDFTYFVAGNELYEDCFTPSPGLSQVDANAPVVPSTSWNYDYPCRTPCWEILYSSDIQVFDDRFANGNMISQQRVAQIPFYDYQPALIDVRQLSLTPDAYRYYKLFADQSQKAAGLVDVPPTALGGNVHRVANSQVQAVGYFTASAVSVVHYWLDRADRQGYAYGADPTGKHINDGDDLFFALNGRSSHPEPPPLYILDDYRETPKVKIWPYTDRPPTAPCLQSDNRTPFKPEGWRE
ncbi:DUF4249 family protein [Spirosoma sp. HMF4905]|uniref:DUF4249 family protein n=1 Tax=Spirosoma arboris TaxID=2682092 RepID=A0A7K1SDC1_9BACT|nr:DUF4249 domain-containing protein [Spirosoma arboris]MVM31790.1 DUF4249 family protein [Spirosoma arboris]